MKFQTKRFIYVIFIWTGIFALSDFGVRTLQAAPAAPVALRMVQPDGTWFTAVPFGDEWYSGYEVDGFTILQNSGDDYWYYARSRRDGKLVPSQRRVGIQTPGSLPRHLRDRPRLQQRDREIDLHQIATDRQPGTTGSHPVLILLVDFTPSTSLSTTVSQWHSIFFSNTTGIRSVKTFYEEASYGRFTIVPAAESAGIASDGVVTVTLNQSHPNTGFNTGPANRFLVRDALIAADADVDYALFDTDGSGSLDATELHVVTVLRGFETSFAGGNMTCPPGVWAHRGSLLLSETPTLDGVTVSGATDGGGYIQFGEWYEKIGNGCQGTTGNMATMGIMAHELGRDLNWPSLYDIDGSSAGVGRWSLMGHGLWGAVGGEPAGATPVLPDAFSKWYQGWLTPTVVTTTRTAVPISNSVQHDVVYQVLDNPGGIDWQLGSSSGTGEYFLIENRQQLGFDAGLAAIDPAAAGCLIWHIDETRPGSNLANKEENRKLVDLEEADGAQDLDHNTNRGDPGDPWPGSSGSTIFDGSTFPDSDLYDSTPSGVRIANIAATGTGCTVDFTTDLPVIASYPTSLTSPQTPDAFVTRTLIISNTGGEALNWSIVEQTGGAQNWIGAGPPTPVPASPIVTLWEQARNGNNGLLSAYSAFDNNGAYVAADFTVDEAVQITTIFADGKENINPLANQPAINWVIYADANGEPAGHPEDGSGWTSAQWYYTAPLTTTGLNITNGAITIDLVTAGAPPLTLAPGTYWLTVFPTYNNPVNLGTHWEWNQAALVDQDGLFISPNLFLIGSWTSFSLVGQVFDDVAFRLEGRAVCPVADLPWLSISPTTGRTAVGSGSDVDFLFDSGGQAPGTYTGSVCIDSNDPKSPLLTVPVTMTVCAPPAAVSDVTISHSGGDVTLAWSTTGAGLYQIYRAGDNPYFTPGPGNLIGTTGSSPYTDANATSNAGSNYSYLVLAADACGTGTVTSANSNRTGEFDFAIVPGS